MTRRLVAALAAAALAAPGAAQAQGQPNAGDGTHACGKVAGHTVEAGRTTTCGFARNVTRAGRWMQRYTNVRDGRRFRVRSYSRATQRSYWLTCRQWSGRRGVQVLCSGGNGAMINYYRYR